MRVPRSLPYVLSAGLIAAGIAQYRAHEAATAQLRSFATLARPAALIRAERLWPFLWGGGLAWNVSLEPAGEIKKALGVPFGYQIRAQRLRLHAIEMAPDGFPRAFDLSLSGAQLPVPAIEGAALPEPPALRRPRLRELGVEQLDGTLRLRFERLADGAWQLAFDGAAQDLGRLAGAIAGTPGPRFVHGDLSDFALTQAEARWADAGLARLILDWLARHARQAPSDLSRTLAEHVDRQAREQDWTLDADSQAALRRLAQAPRSATVQLRPLHAVLLKNLPLYRPGDRFALLGVRISDQARFEDEDEPA